MQIHLQALFQDVVKNTGRVKNVDNKKATSMSEKKNKIKYRQGQNKGKQVITQTRRRVILGQAWVFDQQTISRGLEKGCNPIT